MKVRQSKQKGRQEGKMSKGQKKKMASKKSKDSNSVKKNNIQSRSKDTRVNKTSTKIKQYSLRELTEFFERKFNVSVSTDEDLKAKQKKFRNKYLFPAIKDGVVFKREDILFDEKNALQYLQSLSNTLDKSVEYYLEEVP
jgi:hypothetical protein